MEFRIQADAAAGPARHRSRPEVGVAVALIVAMVVSLAWALETFRAFRASTESAKWVAHTHRVREALRDLKETLHEAETDERGLILTQNEHYFRLYESACAAFGRALDEVASLIQDNSTQQRGVERLRALGQAKIADLQQAIALYRRKGQAAALPMISSDRGEAVMNQVQRAVNDMLQEEQRLLDLRLAVDTAAVQRTRHVILFGAIGLLVMITVLATALYRWLLPHSRQPLEEVGPRKMQPAWLGYGVAVAAVAGATWLRWELGSYLGQDMPPYITFYPAIILGAVAGGTGAGLLATALSATIESYLFVPPFGGFVVEKPVDLARLTLFVGINLMTSVVGGALRNARHRARDQARALARTVDLLDLANVMVRDADDRVVRWNTGCQRLYGFTRDQALGKVSHELLHTRFPVPLATIRSELSATGRWQGELRQTASDGREVVVASEWLARGEAAGEPGIIIEVDADITARKAAETARDTMAAIIAESDDAVIAKDLNGQITSWNKGAERLYGYTAEEAIGKNILMLIPAERQAEEDRILAAIRRGETLSHYESPRLTRDGRLVDLSITTSPLHDSAGLIVGASNIARDITRRKRAEGALRQAIERYERQVRLFEGIASTTPDFVYVFDLQGRFLYANRRLLEVWGMKLSDATGKTCRELGYQQWHHDMHMREIAQVVQTKRPIKGEVSFKAPLTGIFGVYEYIFTPVIGPDGEVELIAGTTRDVTRRKRAAEELERVVRERTAKLQEMVAELEHFSYTITHDMRAPLRAMRGLARLLVEECGSRIGGERLGYLQQIADSAERMDELITDALQYSLLVRGQFELEPVDADALLRGILKSYPHFHPPHAHVRVGNRLPVVLANRAGLTQCFSNLLGNAVKFVYPGQTPEVLVRAETATGEAEPRDAMTDRPVPPGKASSPLSSWHIPEKTAAAIRSNGRHSPRPVRIWFEDKGIGIGKEYQDKVWVMFQRLNKSYAGTGIGLALVRKAVERMGGRVGLESEPGHGSRFWVELQSADGILPPDDSREIVRNE